ncbi:MAG: DUF3021 family protein [Vagococcus sp.]|uniref:DUF3021 family protein n=1 Tax=Vagococcus sp. TaxID=1933889 RepID=UPI002FCC913A
MEFIKRNALGIAIGSVITLVAKLIFNVEIITSQEIGFNFYVAVVVSSLSFLDHIERLSYWQITLCHFLGSYVMIAFGYFYLFPFTVARLLTFTLNTVVTYIVIWSAFVIKNYFVAKNLDRQLKK